MVVVVDFEDVYAGWEDGVSGRVEGAGRVCLLVERSEVGYVFADSASCLIPLLSSVRGFR